MSALDPDPIWLLRATVAAESGHPSLVAQTMHTLGSLITQSRRSDLTPAAFSPPINTQSGPLHKDALCSDVSADQTVSVISEQSEDQTVCIIPEQSEDQTVCIISEQSEDQTAQHTLTRQVVTNLYSMMETATRLAYFEETRLAYLEPRTRTVVGGPYHPTRSVMNPARNVLHSFIPAPPVSTPPPVATRAFNLAQLTFGRPLAVCANKSSCLCYQLCYRRGPKYVGPPLNVALSPAMEFDFQGHPTPHGPVQSGLCLLCLRAMIPGQQAISGFAPPFTNLPGEYASGALAAYSALPDAHYVLPLIEYMCVDRFVTNGVEVSYVDERLLLVGGPLDKVDFRWGMPPPVVSTVNVQRLVACLPVDLASSVVHRLTASLLEIVVGAQTDMTVEDFIDLLTWRRTHLNILLHTTRGLAEGRWVEMWYDMHWPIWQTMMSPSKYPSAYDRLMELYACKLAPEQQAPARTQAAAIQLARHTIRDLQCAKPVTPVGRLLVALATNRTSFVFDTGQIKLLLPAIQAVGLDEIGSTGVLRDCVLGLTVEDIESLMASNRSAVYMLAILAFTAGLDLIQPNCIATCGDCIIASGLSELITDARFRRRGLFIAWITKNSSIRSIMNGWKHKLVVRPGNTTRMGLDLGAPIHLMSFAARFLTGGRARVLPAWAEQLKYIAPETWSILMDRARAFHIYARTDTAYPLRPTYGFLPCSMGFCLSCLHPVGVNNDTKAAKTLSIGNNIRGLVYCSSCCQPGVVFIDVSCHTVCCLENNGQHLALTECRCCGCLADSITSNGTICNSCIQRPDRLLAPTQISRCMFHHYISTDSRSMVWLADADTPSMICNRHAAEFDWITSGPWRPNIHNLTK